MKNLHSFVVLAYKESNYLESCIKSVLNQNIKTKVFIATTTDNKFIRKIAKKYNLEIITGKHTTIGGDFDFAKNIANTELVTIAHQDDIYDQNFTEEILKAYKQYKDAIIFFSDYYEIKDNKKEFKNINLNIKKLLLLSLRLKFFSGSKFIKRNALRFGNAISCPTVTFVKDKCPKEIFTSDLKCNVDWYAWKKLSKKKGKFIYISKSLMGHRIHDESTTTEIIKENNRRKEDFFMFKKFWPIKIAKILTKFYSYSEKNNNLKKSNCKNK